ncbi:hypothetical protein BDZ91DRAFT_536063 [Kalaharituber pfeilii]|nr:hypothetical protein BDZ91DRAFT_536063 [Kalaharituber pfeilii]
MYFPLCPSVLRGERTASRLPHLRPLSASYWHALSHLPPSLTLSMSCWSSRKTTTELVFFPSPTSKSFLRSQRTPTIVFRSLLSSPSHRRGYGVGGRVTFAIHAAWRGQRALSSPSSYRGGSSLDLSALCLPRQGNFPVAWKIFCGLVATFRLPWPPGPWPTVARASPLASGQAAPLNFNQSTLSFL